MRIALVVSGGFDRSGRERVIPVLLCLLERLARQHSVHVFVLRHYPEPCTYDLLGATIHDLGRATGPTGLRSLAQARRLVRALRLAGPFDVIHGYWAVPAGLLAAFAGRRLGVPSLVTFNSGEFVCLPTFGYGLQCAWRSRLAVALAGRLATRLHVCSHYMERLAHAGGLHVDRIPLGVDVRVFQGSDERPGGPPWRLLYVASLNRVKDQATLLRAMTRIVSREPDVHLDIVGEDTMHGAVQAQCAALNLDRYISFHGFQPTDRLPPFYQRAHLLVLPSRHEAAGVVVLEAAACGLPAIGTAAGYIADWSPAGAYAVGAGDDEALADGIVELLRDPVRRDAIGREAERRTRAHDADWTAGAIERVYHALIAPRADSRSLRGDLE